MKKYILLLICLVSFAILAEAQKEKLYHTDRDVRADIDSLLHLAKEENKHVLLQVGGNWCKWCIRFHEYVVADTTLSAIVDKNYKLYHLNYSKEQRNNDILAAYDYPQRFGFPVFVILDADGKRLHTQDSWMLESHKKEEHYNKELVQHFLHMWSPKALDPSQYKK